MINTTTNFHLLLMKKNKNRIIRVGLMIVSMLLLFFTSGCKDAMSQNKTNGVKGKLHVYKSIVKDTFLISKIAQDTLGFKIYKPARMSEQKHPVLFMMHGHGGNHYDWFDVKKGNLQHTLDSLVVLKKIPPLVALSIDAKNSWYVDHDSLKMEHIFMKEFIPFVKKYFGETIDNKHINLVGNSMGGYGALNYALKYPESFKNIILLAPAAYKPLPPKISSSRKIPVFKKDGVFNDSLWNYHLYSSIKLLKDKSIYPKFYLSTGDDDEFDIFSVVVQLNSYFQKEALENEVTVINGKHEWKVWRSCFKQDVVRLFEN